MRLSKQKQPGALRFNLTPMIDIVFLLIIFFMTVAQITRVVDTPLPLPRVSSGQETKKTATVVINMTEEGGIILAGEPTPIEVLSETLVKRVADQDNDPNRVPIQIRVHRACRSRHVTRLLKRLSELGFTNVRSAIAE
ncbi:MAG: biopolymer transporter ExbD [Planctomycetota bacterium]